MNTNAMGRSKTMGLHHKLIDEINILAKNAGGAGLWRSGTSYLGFFQLRTFNVSTYKL